MILNVYNLPIDISMKILVSAYACQPNFGSEPMVGFEVPSELAKKGHSVTIITRTNNRNDIEAFFLNNPKSRNLNFFYYDLPSWAKFWKKGSRGIRSYYFIWQIGAYYLAKKLHKKINFDCVHHVTFVSFLLPSFMGNLGIPFIFGPISTNSLIPWRLSLSTELKMGFVEIIRCIAIFTVRINPFILRSFAQASTIYITSNVIKAYIPNKFHNKIRVQLAIGCTPKKTFFNLKKKQSFLRILFVGRFVTWKGLHLAIPAFAKLHKIVPEVRFTIVGRGTMERSLKNLAYDLNISDKINWVPWVKQDELDDIYQSHDIFFFPSLRDTGGLVVLEAMANALPVVCFDTGGPGVIVNKSCGEAVNIKGLCQSELIDSLFQALYKIINNVSHSNKLRKGALLRIKDFSWEKIINNIYGKKILKKKHEPIAK